MTEYRRKIDRDFNPNLNDAPSSSPDAFAGLVVQKASDSRYSVGINGYPLSSANGGFNATPMLPGNNAFSFFTEVNGDLINQAPMENTLLA